MPYIERDKRKQLLPEIDALAKAIESLGEVHPGNVNFAISKLLHYLYMYDGVSYANINEAIGVLECVKQELYRRLAAPYEDQKKEENGDVF